MKKLLVVDDDIDILEALKLTFELSGFTVETKNNGKNIEEVIKTFQPDAIILDVLLSGYDGRIICQQLKHHNDTKHIPIIMISAHPDAQTATLAAGANAFLAKPFEIDALIETVEKFIEGK